MTNIFQRGGPTTNQQDSVFVWVPSPGDGEQNIALAGEGESAGWREWLADGFSTPKTTKDIHTFHVRRTVYVAAKYELKQA